VFSLLQAFWTDIEGNYDYFRQLVAISDAVGWGVDRGNSNGIGATERLELKDGCGLVFGGDCFDKGAGDLRVSRQLVDLKRRHPERVALLIGNRDVNKMRFATELEHEHLVACSPDEIQTPFFLGDRAISYPDFLKERGGSAADSPRQRMQYILQMTMGSPGCFEHRRQELAVLGGKGDEPSAVSDEAVMRSFVDGAKQGGIYHDYLQHAQLGVCYGNTLFTHGAVTSAAAGYVPDTGSTCEVMGGAVGKDTSATHSVRDWIGMLEDYASHGLQQWAASPSWCSSRERRVRVHFSMFTRGLQRCDVAILRC
jgi:hypothetical protein